MYCVTLKIPVRRLAGPSIVPQTTPTTRPAYVILLECNVTLTRLATIWGHWQMPNFCNSPNFFQPFPKFFPNVLIYRQTFSVLSRSLEFCEMFRIPDCLVMAFFETKSQRLLFFPNILQAVAKYSQGSPFVHQTIPKQSPIRRLITTLVN